MIELEGLEFLHWRDETAKAIPILNCSGRGRPPPPLETLIIPDRALGNYKEDSRRVKAHGGKGRAQVLQERVNKAHRSRKNASICTPDESQTRSSRSPSVTTCDSSIADVVEAFTSLTRNSDFLNPATQLPQPGYTEPLDQFQDAVEERTVAEANVEKVPQASHIQDMLSAIVPETSHVQDTISPVYSGIDVPQTADVEAVSETDRTPVFDDSEKTMAFEESELTDDEDEEERTGWQPGPRPVKQQCPVPWGELRAMDARQRGTDGSWGDYHVQHESSVYYEEVSASQQYLRRPNETTVMDFITLPKTKKSKKKKNKKGKSASSTEPNQAAVSAVQGENVTVTESAGQNEAVAASATNGRSTAEAVSESASQTAPAASSTADAAAAEDQEQEAIPCWMDVRGLSPGTTKNILVELLISFGDVITCDPFYWDPATGIGSTKMLMESEQAVDWACDCLNAQDAAGLYSLGEDNPTDMVFLKMAPVVPASLSINDVD